MSVYPSPQNYYSSPSKDLSGSNPTKKQRCDEISRKKVNITANKILLHYFKKYLFKPFLSTELSLVEKKMFSEKFFIDKSECSDGKIYYRFNEDKIVVPFAYLHLIFGDRSFSLKNAQKYTDYKDQSIKKLGNNLIKMGYLYHAESNEYYLQSPTLGSYCSNPTSFKLVIEFCNPSDLASLKQTSKEIKNLRIQDIIPPKSSLWFNYPLCRTANSEVHTFNTTIYRSMSSIVDKNRIFPIEEKSTEISNILLVLHILNAKNKGNNKKFCNFGPNCIDYTKYALTTNELIYFLDFFKNQNTREVILKHSLTRNILNLSFTKGVPNDEMIDDLNFEFNCDVDVKAYSSPKAHNLELFFASKKVPEDCKRWLISFFLSQTESVVNRAIYKISEEISDKHSAIIVHDPRLEILFLEKLKRLSDDEDKIKLFNQAVSLYEKLPLSLHYYLENCEDLQNILLEHDRQDINLLKLFDYYDNYFNDIKGIIHGRMLTAKMYESKAACNSIYLNKAIEYFVSACIFDKDDTYKCDENEFFETNSPSLELTRVLIKQLQQNIGDTYHILNTFNNLLDIFNKLSPSSKVNLPESLGNLLDNYLSNQDLVDQLKKLKNLFPILYKYYTG